MPFTISQTHVCLMANLVSLNLTLFLTVHFRAVHGYAATHMCIPHVHASLPFCHHHVVAPCYMPALDSISRFNTNMYILYVTI